MLGVVGDRQRVDELRGLRSGDFIFEQRRDIDQRGRIANGVIFVLVRMLINTDRVIAGPIAPIVTVTKWRSAGMKRGRKRHGEFGIFIMDY